jgi:hypothetical protein
LFTILSSPKVFNALHLSLSYLAFSAFRLARPQLPKKQGQNFCAHQKFCPLERLTFLRLGKWEREKWKGILVNK